MIPLPPSEREVRYDVEGVRQAATQCNAGLGKKISKFEIRKILRHILYTAVCDHFESIGVGLVGAVVLTLAFTSLTQHSVE